MDGQTDRQTAPLRTVLDRSTSTAHAQIFALICSRIDDEFSQIPQAKLFNSLSNHQQYSVQWLHTACIIKGTNVQKIAVCNWLSTGYQRVPNPLPIDMVV